MGYGLRMRWARVKGRGGSACSLVHVSHRPSSLFTFLMRRVGRSRLEWQLHAASATGEHLWLFGQEWRRGKWRWDCGVDLVSLILSLSRSLFHTHSTFLEKFVLSLLAVARSLSEVAVVFFYFHNAVGEWLQQDRGKCVKKKWKPLINE